MESHDSPEARAAKTASAATAKAAGKATKVNATEPEARVLRPIAKSRTHLADLRRNHHVVYVDDDIRPADLEDPNLWTSASRDFQIGDRVEVMGGSPAYWAELIVYDMSPGHAGLRLLTTVALPPRRGSAGFRVPAGYRIDPPAFGDAGWQIIREGKDGDFVFNKNQVHKTQLEALTYLVGHAALRG